MPWCVALLFVAAGWAVGAPAMRCNKALCASDVSKCLLQEMCQCKANRTRCCGECAFCLAKLWEPCCDCVGLCDGRISSAPRPAQRSSMHNLVSPVPSLFRALLALSNNHPALGWSIVTLPLEEELRQNHVETGHLLLGPHTGMPRGAGIASDFPRSRRQGTLQEGIHSSLSQSTNLGKRHLSSPARPGWITVLGLASDMDKGPLDVPSRCAESQSSALCAP
ncbi:twisted gastrulation protein homolog 1-like isoform 1-T1 [Liasis olivaceus]